MAYQNVGTFDAGIIQAKGGAPSGGTPTMDAAGIASGQAFLVSELEKRDPLIRKPLTSITYPRDIVVKSGGGWVDYVSAQSVGYGITGGSGESPVQAGGSNGLPIVQANLDKGMFKAHTFAAALRVMWVDMQKANYIGRSLDQMLQDGMRRAYDKHMDENVYTGLPAVWRRSRCRPSGPGTPCRCRRPRPPPRSPPPRALRPGAHAPP